MLDIGAGVLGSYLTHVLCAAGHEVSLAARGRRRQELEQNKLVVRHDFQRRTTVERPRILEQAELQRRAAVFAVMQYQ